MPPRERTPALTYDFEKSVGFWVGLTTHEIERAMSRELAPTGITPRQVQVLACLALYSERSQVELAEDLRIEPSTLVRVLDRMERDGWIERHPSPDDRRKKLVRATPKVKPTWATVVRHGERVERTATRGLSKAELSTLRVLLERVRANLEGERDG